MNPFLTKYCKYKAIRIIFAVIIFFILYLLLPIYLFLSCIPNHRPLIPLLLFYFLDSSIIFYLLRSNLARKRSLNFERQLHQERLNTVTDAINNRKKEISSLQEKIARYAGLKYIIEEINSHLELPPLADSLIRINFSQISRNQGSCILYLVDSHSQKLSIFKSRKEDEHLVIQAKEGDVFDHWVVRHTQPLLVEDIRQDFRFDLERLKMYDPRPISSLVSAPLMSESMFLGLLRLDSPRANFFHQEDLRFLSTICDIGAVAIENALLFQRTKELAIRDGLTSLYTKGYFMERLKEECLRNIHSRAVFSLLVLDIDHFKEYNDRFGHIAGDLVLKDLSILTSEFLKDFNPFLSRFGGEEFCFLLPGLNKQKASALAEDLRIKIENFKLVLRRQETHITASIGIATFPEDSLSETELIQKADRAMYVAKEKGRNRVVCAA